MCDENCKSLSRTHPTPPPKITTQELQAHAAAIVLHELAGYQVKLRNTVTLNGMVPLIATGQMTFDFETWTGPGRGQVEQYGIRKGLFRKMESGLLGEEALFFSKYTKKSDGSEITGDFGEFKDPGVLSQFPKDGAVPKSMLLKDESDESKGFICGPDWTWSLSSVPETHKTTCTTVCLSSRVSERKISSPQSTAL